MSQNQLPMIPHQKNHSEWTQKALCRGYPTDLWFPEVPQGRDYFAHAREVCSQCSVKKDCLAFALKFSADEDKFGMFGGLSPKERLEIRNRNNKHIEPEEPVIVTPSRVDRSARPIKDQTVTKEPKVYTAALLTDYIIDPLRIANRKTKTPMDKKDIPKATKLVMNSTKSLEPSSLTAQASAAMIIAGWEDPLDARTCALMFMGASYVMDLANKGAATGAITAQENAAISGTAELAMRVWKHHFETAKAES